MKTLKSFSTIAFIGLMAWSLCACAAPKTQSPTLPLEASATPAAVATEVRPSPTTVPTLAPTRTISNSEYLQVFEAVWSTINVTYFDPDFGGLDWDAVHAKYEPLIIAAEDDETLYQHLNQMLWELNVSHTGVGPADVWPSVEPVAFEEGEIGIDVRLLDDQAVITRVEAGSPAEEAGLRPGFIIQSIEGTPVARILADAQEHLAPPYNEQGRIDILTRRLLSMIYGDPGTCVTLAYLDERDELREGCVERIQRPRLGYMGGVLPPSYLEFESGRLESGAGYIRFNTFHPDLIPDMVEAVAALQDAPGIMIDLRGNPGGDPNTVEQLAAQFLDGQVLFGSFRTRSGTTARMLTGRNVYTGPLVTLIDASSFSGSEWFASGMQAVGRAVIIGERSPGGATAMNVKALPNGAILGYPVAQLITSDGTVLEGYGVIPDITVTLERSQLLQGIDAQLQAAIRYIVETADARMGMTGTIASPVQQTCGATLPAEGACGGSPPSGCTVFTVSKGDRVFFGGNDDYINPDSYYWVDPGGAQGYGAIWIGTPDNVQQGVNEKGLAYDANGLPRVDVNPHLEREPVSGGYSAYPIHILHECATVEEVIAWVNAHQWHSYMHDQMQFADATGDAVIISAGVDGEVVLTRKPRGDGYLVSTNFNVANPANGYGYPCWRYETATERLSELVSQEGVLTAQDATDVLDAVHVEGGTSWTLESLVADLPNGIVYLYYFRQFDKPVVLNVADEIANARAGGPLSKLFPEDVQREAARRYQQALSNQGRCSQIGKVWVGLVLASLVLLILLSIRNAKGWILWLPVTVVLGPLGLLIWLLARRKQKASAWQAALVEAAGHVPPVAAAYMVMLAVLILIPQTQSNGPLQILFIFVLPLLLGWLFFQGPLLALAARRGYLRTLGQRLPAAWVAANLGMGGISPLAVRLVKWLANNCSLMDLSLWTVMSFWTAVVAGACLGLLLILFYEGWAVHRGCRAWSVLALGDGEVTTPSWRKLWWWFLLSFAVLIAGFLVD